MNKQITEAFEMGRKARMNGFVGAPAQNKELMSRVYTYGKDAKGANKYMRSWMNGYTSANLQIVRNALLNMGA